MAKESKWEGKVTADLPSATAEQVWPFFADFCNFHMWHPALETCHQAGGTTGQPGLIRYCAGKRIPADGGGGGGGEDSIAWSREKLLEIDPIKRCLSYELLENNIGFGSYVAIQKVEEGDDGRGCKIEWAFIADPIDGWKLDDLISVLDFVLRSMAEKMENTVKSMNASKFMDGGPS